MKTKTLKLEGSEKIKFRIEIEYNEANVILTQGGKPTKFAEKIEFHAVDLRDKTFLQRIGSVCNNLYRLYLVGVEFEESILESLEEKFHIELID